eukprot:735655-Pleurochrysis_carterae.AAC.5
MALKCDEGLVLTHRPAQSATLNHSNASHAEPCSKLNRSPQRRSPNSYRSLLKPRAQCTPCSSTRLPAPLSVSSAAGALTPFCHEWS